MDFSQERRWFFIRNGKASDYHGPAVHWRHLSRWERHVSKTHLQYDPVEDLRQRREANLYNRISLPAKPHYDAKHFDGKASTNGKPAANGGTDGYKPVPSDGRTIEE